MLRVQGVLRVHELVCVSECVSTRSGAGIRAVPKGVGCSVGGICTGAAWNGLHVWGCIHHGTHRQVCGSCCYLSWGIHTAGGIACGSPPP